MKKTIQEDWMQRAPVVYFSSRAVPQLAGFAYYDNVYVIGGQAVGPHDARLVIGIHGCGILNGRFVSSSQDAQQALTTTSSKSLYLIGQGLRGSLTVYVAEDGTRSITVLADPLGGGLVYTHEDSDGFGVSSDLAALVSFLSLLGKKPKKSLEYVASYVATGSGGLVSSSYENIKVLPQFSCIKISPGGREIIEYDSKSAFFSSEVSYDDELRAARDEIATNVQALASAPSDRRVAHLTGGIDSRIMLAVILYCGLKDSFSFFCSGGPTEPDQVIARKLASEFGLTMTTHSGLESQWAPETLDQQLLLPFVETAGIISGVVQRGTTRSSSSIASGGYGELFRSFYNKGIEGTSTAEDAERMYGRLAFSENRRHRLFSDTFAAKGLEHLNRAFSEAKRSGVRTDALLDYIYLNKRNRYYVGEISRSTSSYTPRFDPLYSLHGSSLALRIDGVSRDANIVGFDLMNLFHPDLARLPFDSNRFSGSYSRIRTAPPPLGFRSKDPVRFDGATRTPLENRASISTVRPSAADIERANKLKMAPRLVAQAPYIQKGALEILGGMSKDVTESVFNRDALRTLLAKEPSHRLYYRTARDLYAALLWYSHD